MGVWKPIHHS